MLNLPNGTGATTGDNLVTARPFLTSGNVWWVNSATGTDAAAPAGKDRERPLATLAQANTNSAAGDTIVLMDGHTETIAALITLTASIIAGEGTTGGNPTVRLTNNQAAGSMILLSSLGQQIRNVWFPTNLQSNSAAGGRVNITGVDCSLIGCYFECGPNDTTSAVTLANTSQGNRFENCTFISTATTIVTRPARGLMATTATNDTFLKGCVFSDGTKGFSTAACDFNGGQQTRLHVESCSLLLGANMLIQSTSTYRIAGLTVSGGGRVTAP